MEEMCSHDCCRHRNYGIRKDQPGLIQQNQWCRAGARNKRRRGEKDYTLRRRQFGTVSFVFWTLYTQQIQIRLSPDLGRGGVETSGYFWLMFAFVWRVQPLCTGRTFINKNTEVKRDMTGQGRDNPDVFEN